MLSLVADLILLAKLESGEINLELSPIDVPALVQHAIASSDSDHVEMYVDLDLGPRLSGDPQLVGQLIDIAIGVVVAGSAGGADVVVQAEPRPSGWHLAVTTSAADAATAERLLSTQLPHPDAANERRTGALAVMLARAIAARHGGELSMTMRSPGASLTIDLPIKP
jgi:K+-sensing histidine kinase KdpD